MYCSGLSSAGNTPRLSESFSRGTGNMSTFFTQNDLASSLKAQSREFVRDNPSLDRNHLPDHRQKDSISASSTSLQKPSSSSTMGRSMAPPSAPPKPFKGPKATTHNSVFTPQTHETRNSTLNTHNKQSTQHPPPYNLAVKQKVAGQGSEGDMPKTTKSFESERSHTTTTITTNSNSASSSNKSYVRPVVKQHGSSSSDFTDSNQKQYPLNMKQMPVNVLPNMSDINYLQRRPKNPNTSQNKSVRIQNRWSHGSDIEEEYLASSQGSILSKSMNYSSDRPRPSSATDCVHSSISTGDRPNLYQTPAENNELLKKRSNSALGYRNHHSKDLQQSQIETQRHESLDYNIEERGLYEFKCTHSNPLVYGSENSQDHESAERKRSKFRQRPSSSPHRKTPENISDQNINGSASFAYGSLKRSPRNLNLSRQSSSDIRAPLGVTNAETTVRNDPSSSNVEDNNDKPPPLPPRSEKFKRQSSTRSRSSPLMNSFSARRESPQDNMLTSSHRSRSGSRTSVEIQDITENQYIIYNPDSPVTECFDLTKSFHYTSTSDPVKSAIQNERKQPSAHDIDKNNMKQVPSLELPDDLLGTSETESTDEIFLNKSSINNNNNSYFDKNYNKRPGMTHTIPMSRAGSTGKVHQNQDNKYPDDIYVDVHEYNLNDSVSASHSLKVLPLEGAMKYDGKSYDTNNE